MRSSWDASTCDPVHLPWSMQNPSRQWGVTALVLHDLLGGELLAAEVTLDGGGRQGFHLLPDGTEVDLSRGQLQPHEHVGGLGS